MLPRLQYRTRTERTSLLSTDSDWSTINDPNSDAECEPYQVVEESETVLPQEISPRYDKIFHEKKKYYNNIEESLEDSMTSSEADNIWQLNYNEAAIYLEVSSLASSTTNHELCSLFSSLIRN